MELLDGFENINFLKKKIIDILFNFNLNINWSYQD